MSNVFSEIVLNLEKDGSTYQLEHAILKPNFYISAEIMHQSIITGKRTFSNDLHYSEITIRDLLFKYDDPSDKFAELSTLEDQEFLFTPFDLAWSRNVYIMSVTLETLGNTFIGDALNVAVIHLIAVEPGIIGGYVYNISGQKVQDIAGNYLRRRIRGLLS